MSTVREATTADLDQIVAMGFNFISYSEYGDMIDPDPDKLKIALLVMLEKGKIFVAEHDGLIVGFIIGMQSSFWFAPEVTCAVELAWWVKEEHRGGRAAIKLLRAFEGWAKEIGTKVVCMSDLIIGGEAPTGALFSKLGYSVTERAHIKRI